MRQVVSPSTGATYGLARVRRVWELARSTVYAQRRRAARHSREAGSCSTEGGAAAPPARVAAGRVQADQGAVGRRG
jgi:hypothetical protein